MTKIVLIFLSLIPSYLFAQKVSGTLIDSTTKSPVPYANIGVLSRGMGTVSDEKGQFSLNLSSNYDKDTIMISVIGFEPLSMNVAIFKSKCTNGCTLEMRSTNYDLQAIEIASKALERRIVGVPNPKENISIGFSGNGLGIEAGTYMKIKRPAYLEKVNIQVATCSNDSIFFRLNVYDTKRGMPDKNILKRPIYLSCACEDILNSFEIDVIQENIYLEDDFVVALENFKKNNEVQDFFFKGKMFSKGIYYRLASQDDWQKFGIVAAGISATVLEEK